MSDRYHTDGNLLREVDWLWERILCHFSFYDRPLSGLCVVDGVYHYFLMVTERDGDWEIDHESPDRFVIWEIDWTTECQEYLDDYRRYYGHCFHENGRRWRRFDPMAELDLSEFQEKWNNRRVFFPKPTTAKQGELYE